MIRISSQELAQRSGLIKSQIADLRTAFETATSRMRAMEASWSSPASRAFIQEYETMIPLAENYCQVCDSFAAYLDQTAAAYQETEQVLAAGMSS